MKHYIARTLVFLIMLFTFSAEVFSAEPIISIVTANQRITVSKGNSLGFNVSFNYSGAVEDIKSKSFSLGYYGNMSLITGELILEDFNFSENYYYSFQTSSEMTTEDITIPLSVTYTYYDAGRVLRTKTVSESIDVRISDTNTTNPTPTSNAVEIANIKAADTPEGENPVVIVDITNNSFFDISNGVLTIINGQRTFSKHIGSIMAGGASSVEIILDPYENGGQKYLNSKFEFRTPNGIISVVNKSFYIYITKSAPLTITDFTAPKSIYVGESAEFKFKLANRSDIEYKNAVVSLYQDRVLLGTTYLGRVSQSGATDVSFTHIFDNSGTDDYYFKINYENNISRLEVEKKFNLTIKSLENPSISSPLIPSEITSENATEITFDVVNKNRAGFINTSVYLQRNGIDLASKYIGKIEGESSASASISYVFSKEGKYDIVAKATDPEGKMRQIKKTIDITIKSSSGSNSVGDLRIQNIFPPIEPLIKTAAEVKVTVTNPSSDTVKGAELFLYNFKNEEIYSVYISEISPNSTLENILFFPTGDVAETEIYKLKLKYKQESGKAKTITRDFPVMVKEEEKTGEKDEEKEKPAYLKIQKIESPLTAYRGVRTKIPFTLSNAGKGTAYNVEIYVIDNDSGVEIAREYIGNIPAASSTSELYYYTKLSDVGELTATLTATYENDDGTGGVAEKDYTQNIIDYRVSVTDIGGLEWAQVGQPATVEFALQNSGTADLLNTTAYLSDDKGNTYGELFIGTVSAATKLERQKFKNIIFSNEGDLKLIINVSYENDDMQIFEFQGVQSAFVQPPYDPNMGIEKEPPIMEEEFVGEGETDNHLPLWGWILIIAFSAIISAGTVVLIILRKKKIREKEEEDIEFFLKQFAGSPSEKEKEDAQNKEEITK